MFVLSKIIFKVFLLLKCERVNTVRFYFILYIFLYDCNVCVNVCYAYV